MDTGAVRQENSRLCGSARTAERRVESSAERGALEEEAVWLGAQEGRIMRNLVLAKVQLRHPAVQVGTSSATEVAEI